MRTIVIEPTLNLVVKRSRVAAYARVSVGTELSESSFTAQLDHFINLINSRHDWINAGVYSDYGISGTSAERTGFRSLMQACDAGKVDIILTKSISRFCRNTVDLLNTVRHLNDRGINVHFERENIDSQSCSGEVLLTLLASFAQEESRSISENTRWAFRKNFEKGIGCHTNPMLGYRFNGDGFDVVDDEARTVRLIFDLYLKGMSPDKITSYLNDNGYRSVKGRPFKYGCIWDILRQEKYTGNSLLQKTFSDGYLTQKTKRNKGQLTQYYVEGTHPVIIDQETFDAVRSEIQRRKALGYRANTSRQFSVFSGKLVCAKCGKTYRRRNVGTSGRHKTNYAYWKCTTRLKEGKAGCPSSSIPEKLLYSLASEVTSDLERITKIDVDDNLLRFHLDDGTIAQRKISNGAE